MHNKCVCFFLLSCVCFFFCLARKQQKITCYLLRTYFFFRFADSGYEKNITIQIHNNKLDSCCANLLFAHLYEISTNRIVCIRIAGIADCRHMAATWTMHIVSVWQYWIVWNKWHLKNPENRHHIYWCKLSENTNVLMNMTFINGDTYTTESVALSLAIWQLCSGMAWNLMCNTFMDRLKF